MSKYRRKPIEIDAIKLSCKDNERFSLMDFCGDKLLGAYNNSRSGDVSYAIFKKSYNEINSQSTITIDEGDYIIKSDSGDLSSMSRSEFELISEVVDD